ncbi:hypothetical protein GIS00_05485 [Nakamurella sp. YIM 132087]|uniref:META domain-containing protein n=1 Tax=Nakamurella alba TaxID=2665158 RepID=A0A7K1FH24_9ACTN|nr:hypothetical protein [Nakamurella alba]MTD13398.1 hypothetical protein [Nakamurella alba]
MPVLGLLLLATFSAGCTTTPVSGPATSGPGIASSSAAPQPTTSASGQPPIRSAEVVADVSEYSEIDLKDWDLVAETVDGKNVFVPDTVAPVMKLRGENVWGDDGCNSFGGLRVSFGAGSMTFSGPYSTSLVACGYPVADTIAPTILAFPPSGTYDWTLSGDDLRLTRPGATLDFELSADNYASSLTGTPPNIIDEGGGTSDHRLTWTHQAGSDTWTLLLEFRRATGEPDPPVETMTWSASTSWPPAEGTCRAIRRGHSWDVYGFAAPDAASIKGTANGVTAMSHLRLHQPDWDSDLQVFTGSVTAPRGKPEVRTYDADGQLLPPVCDLSVFR